MKPVLAKYLRISDEDVDLDGIEKHESNSVKNQRDLLNDYIANSAEFAGYDVVEYLDDGRTGTNFSRPGVQSLIEAAEAGKIQCIIVKDLTRWGRNYLEVGDFLEQKFPAWGVRFISIGDMYDSATLVGGTTGGINMAFRGLIAQMYSQDLSEKVRSGKDAASRSGKIVTSQPTYGYDMDKNDRHKFAINSDEAAIVRKIFDLAEKGIRIAEITRILNSESVITPQASKQARGYDSKTGRGDTWARGMVRSILYNEKYTGKWIYGKSRVMELGSKRATPVPKSEWIVVEDAIPAIITTKQFAKVQEVLSKRFKSRKNEVNNSTMFAGKIKCGECGRGMAYHKLKDGLVYKCVMRNHSNKFDCITGRLAEREIYDAVLNSLRILALLSKEELQRQSRAIVSNFLEDESKHSKIRTQQLAIEKAKVEKMALWEEFYNGIISRESFQNKGNRISELIAKHENNIANLEAEASDSISSIDIDVAERYNSLNGITQLSKELVSEMVKEIRIYSPERIEIAWTYGDPFMV